MGSQFTAVNNVTMVLVYLGIHLPCFSFFKKQLGFSVRDFLLVLSAAPSVFSEPPFTLSLTKDRVGVHF